MCNICRNIIVVLRYIYKECLCMYICSIDNIDYNYIDDNDNEKDNEDDNEDSVINKVEYVPLDSYDKEGKEGKEIKENTLEIELSPYCNDKYNPGNIVIIIDKIDKMNSVKDKNLTSLKHRTSPKCSNRDIRETMDEDFIIINYN